MYSRKHLTITTRGTPSAAIRSDRGGAAVTLNLTNQEVTGNTYVKSLTNKDSTNSNINLNGYKLYVNGVELTK